MRSFWVDHVPHAPSRSATATAVQVETLMWYISHLTLDLDLADPERPRGYFKVNRSVSEKYSGHQYKVHLVMFNYSVNILFRLNKIFTNEKWCRLFWCVNVAYFGGKYFCCSRRRNYAQKFNLRKFLNYSRYHITHYVTYQYSILDSPPYLGLGWE